MMHYFAPSERNRAMKIETKPLGPDEVLVALSGRLDVVGVPKVEGAFSAVSTRSRIAIVDMSETPYIASIGIRLLLTNAKALSRRGGRLILCGCDPQVEKVLRTTGLDQLIPLLASVADACAHAGLAPPVQAGALSDTA